MLGPTFAIADYRNYKNLIIPRLRLHGLIAVETFLVY